MFNRAECPEGEPMPLYPVETIDVDADRYILATEKIEDAIKAAVSELDKAEADQNFVPFSDEELTRAIAGVVESYLGNRGVTFKQFINAFFTMELEWADPADQARAETQALH
jgi:hypothetical protein